MQHHQESPFFDGSVADAVAQASLRACTFVVLLFDQTEQSRRFDDAFAQEELAGLVRNETVAVRLAGDSPDATMFAQLFPVTQVPSLYFIRGGVLRDVILALATPEDLLQRLRTVIEATAVAEEPPAVQRDLPHPIPSPSSSATPPAAVAVPTVPSSTAIAPSSSAVPRAATNEEESSQTAENEKKEKQERLRKQIEENRKKRAAEEAEKQRQQEIDRRNTGKGLQGAQRDLKDKEARRAADELAKEKREADEAKRRVLEQIARDKADRAAARQQQQQRPQQPQLETDDKQRTETAVSRAQNTYANVNIRQLNGSTIRNRFEAKDTLADLQKWISENRTDGDSPYALSQAYPSRTFTDDDKARTLAELDLSPSGTLLLRPARYTGSRTDDGGGDSGIVWNALSAGASAISGVLDGVVSTVSGIYRYVTASPLVTVDGDGHADTRLGGEGPSLSSSSSSSRRQDDTKQPSRRPYASNIVTLSSASSSSSSSSADPSDRDPRSTYNGNSTNQM